MKLAVERRAAADGVTTAPVDWHATEPWERFGARATVALAASALLGWLLMSGSGAIVSPGTVILEGASTAVQSPQGGVVAKILVANGDWVRIGQPLITFDGAKAHDAMTATSTRLSEYAIEETRLIAERDMKESFETPTAIAAADSETAKSLAIQRALFDERRAARSDRHKALSQRLAKLDVDLTDASGRLASKLKERDLNEREMSAAGPLFGASAAANPQRVGDLQRQSVRLGVEVSAVKGEVAKLKAARSEVETQLAQTGKQYRQQAIDDLERLQARVAEASQEKTALAGRLATSDVTAPAGGYIHALSVATVGAIVEPDGTLAQIIPDNGELLIGVRIAPENAGSVEVGQHATVRLQRAGIGAAIPPRLAGRVRSITGMRSASAQEPAFALALVEVPREQVLLLARGQPLLPGMAAEVALDTGSRRLLPDF